MKMHILIEKSLRSLSLSLQTLIINILLEQICIKDKVSPMVFFQKSLQPKIRILILKQIHLFLISLSIFTWMKLSENHKCITGRYQDLDHIWLSLLFTSQLCQLLVLKMLLQLKLIMTKK